MDYLTKLYKNRAEELQEKLSLLETKYKILSEQDNKPSGKRVSFSTVIDGKTVTGTRSVDDPSDIEFDEEPDPYELESPSAIEDIPLVGQISQNPIAAAVTAAGLSIPITIGGIKRLKSLEAARKEAIKAGKEIAAGKTTDVPNISDPVKAEYRPVAGEKPISTARSGFGLTPGADTRESSRIHREFSPTQKPATKTVMGPYGVPVSQTVTPRYKTPDMPGYTFKLNPKTGEMVANPPLSTLQANAPRLQALEKLSKIAGLGLISKGIYDVATEGPSVGAAAELAAGTAAVAPKLTGKAVGKVAAKIGLKKIPGIGALVGLGLGADRAMAGDWLGAGGEVLSGVAGTVPFIGTAGSFAIDAALLKRDLDAASTK